LTLYLVGDIITDMNTNTHLTGIPSRVQDI